MAGVGGEGLCVRLGLPRLATPVPSSSGLQPRGQGAGGKGWRRGESPTSVYPHYPPPGAHAHRLESVSQLPPTVPTLGCCQFVAFPANPPLLLLLRSQLSRRDRGHEVWGPGAAPPSIPNLLFFQNPVLPDSGKDARASVALRPWWSLTPLVRKFLPLLLPTPRPSCDAPYSPSPLGVSEAGLGPGGQAQVHWWFHWWKAHRCH